MDQEMGHLIWSAGVKSLLLFSSTAVPEGINMFTDGGKKETSVIIFKKKIPTVNFRKKCESVQFKEIFAVIMALTLVKSPMDLFSDSLYVTNLFLVCLFHTFR